MSATKAPSPDSVVPPPPATSQWQPDELPGACADPPVALLDVLLPPAPLPEAPPLPPLPALPVLAPFVLPLLEPPPVPVGAGLPLPWSETTPYAGTGTLTVPPLTENVLACQ